MKVKKIISIVLAVLMLTTLTPLFAFGNSTAVTVTLTLSGADTAERLLSLSVTPDYADSLGYRVAEKDHNGVPVEGVTILDVMAMAHTVLYGEKFLQNPEEYLFVNNGYISKAFTKNASATGFTVNHFVPNDEIVNPLWGSCTGYSCDTAVVQNGDEITYFFYRDVNGWSDYSAWFDKASYLNGEYEAFTVSVSGYCAMWYGCYPKEEVIKQYVKPLKGVLIYGLLNGEEVLLGQTDENGKAELTLENAGEYLIFLKGQTEEGCPVTEGCAKAVITKADNKPTDNPNQNTGIWQWLQNLFLSVKAFFARILGLR